MEYRSLHWYIPGFLSCLSYNPIMYSPPLNIAFDYVTPAQKLSTFIISTFIAMPEALLNKLHPLNIEICSHGELF